MKVRIPDRLVTFVVASRDYQDWQDGRGVLATDRPLFSAITSGEPRADGSLHVEANDALAATIHQWALLLSYDKGENENDRRANVRSARSVIRQITT